MASKDKRVDKQSFMLCVPPCPRFITGGDTHSFVCCLSGSGACSVSSRGS